MENYPPPVAGVVNPQADLEELSRARSTVEDDAVLDFGPWWYAPIIATMFAAISVFGRIYSVWGNIAAILVGALACAVVGVHDYRRRKVWARKSARSFAIAALGFVLPGYLGAAAWGTAISTVGIERFVPVYLIVAWVATSVFFLGMRALLYELRRRRQPLQ